MKKGFVAGMLTAILILSISGTVFAHTGTVTQELIYNNIGVTLDGKRLDLRDAQGNSVEPFMFNGTNYLPVRVVAEAVGLEVGWDSENSTVVLTTPEISQTIYMTRTGSKYHYDGSCNGGTYWPVSLSTALGFGLEPCDKCVLKVGS